jgi:hypothetical protein
LGKFVNIYILVDETGEVKALGRNQHVWEYNIKTYLKYGAEYGLYSYAFVYGPVAYYCQLDNERFCSKETE